MTTRAGQQENKKRCPWVTENPLYVDYHDHEWGRRPKADAAWFEALCLEALQAGLSWLTVLQKRDAFRAIFSDFVPAKVAGMTDASLGKCLSDARLIRHKGKIWALRQNAHVFLDILKAWPRFEGYLAHVLQNTQIPKSPMHGTLHPKENAPSAPLQGIQAPDSQTAKYISKAACAFQKADAPLPLKPLRGDASKAFTAMLAKDLKKRGMRFVGPTTTYSFLEASDLVGGHAPGCFLHTTN